MRMEDDILSLCSAGSALGLPTTLYLGEFGRDVRNDKLSELGFSTAVKGKELILKRLSESTGPPDNHDKSMELADDDCNDSKCAWNGEGHSPCIACDDLQQALAVAAFWKWKCCESVSAAHFCWNAYITGMVKDLKCNKMEWQELQALFTPKP